VPFVSPLNPGSSGTLLAQQITTLSSLANVVAPCLKFRGRRDGWLSCLCSAPRQTLQCETTTFWSEPRICLVSATSDFRLVARCTICNLDLIYRALLSRPQHRAPIVEQAHSQIHTTAPRPWRTLDIIPALLQRTARSPSATLWLRLFAGPKIASKSRLLPPPKTPSSLQILSQKSRLGGGHPPLL
jgi:hypothetical protein